MAIAQPILSTGSIVSGGRSRQEDGYPPLGREPPNSIRLLGR